MQSFRERLIESVKNHGHQILVFTCRPLDYLPSEALPTAAGGRFEGDDRKLVVLDMEQVIAGTAEE